MEKFVLAGDMGGTKTVVGVFSTEQGPTRPLREKTYRTNDMASFRALLEDFQAELAQSANLARAPISAACFGVPGPVSDLRADVVVNVNWPIDARDMADLLGHRRVDLVNDLVAMAYGVLVLPESALATLNEGEPDPAGNRALIAAGTGLGHSMMVRHQGVWIPVPSEGGHVDFSPNNEIEIDLLRYMWNIYGRISTERIVSGPGLRHIYEFLRDTGRVAEQPALRDQMQALDPSMLISRHGLDGSDQLCSRALDLFVHIYGAEAGDFALATLARGGIYLGGGIPPKILSRLESGDFMSGFTNKGRLSGFVRQIPVKVILEPKTPLFGAASRAMMLLAD